MLGLSFALPSYANVSTTNDDLILEDAVPIDEFFAAGTIDNFEDDFTDKNKAFYDANPQPKTAITADKPDIKQEVKQNVTNNIDMLADIALDDDKPLDTQVSAISKVTTEATATGSTEQNQVSQTKDSLPVDELPAEEFEFAQPFITSEQLTDKSVLTDNESDTNNLLAAYSAAKKNDTATLGYYNDTMQSSLFAMYPQYWQLSSDLKNARAHEVLAFEKRFTGTVLAEKLVADFAETKAAHNDYEAVQAVTPFIRNADTSEQCAIGIGQLGLEQQVSQQLQSNVMLANMKSLKSLCRKLAMQLASSNEISTDIKYAQLISLLRQNYTTQAIELAKHLGLSGITKDTLHTIERNPLAYLQQQYVDPDNQDINPLLLYALSRQAKKDFDIAFNWLGANQQRLNAQNFAYANRVLAIHNAQSLINVGYRPELMELFTASSGVPMGDYEAVLYARIAARFGAWVQLLQAISQMSTERLNERTWQYWFARAVVEAGGNTQQDVAKKYYQQLAKKNDYYGLLAQNQLQTTFKEQFSAADFNDTQVSLADTQRMFDDAHFSRAFALKKLSKKAKFAANFAKREWNWAVRNAILNNDEKMILAAIAHADAIGWYNRSVYAANKLTTITNKQYQFPTPFADSVADCARIHGTQQSLIYAIMRQESRFDAKIRSHVGATGLMQIMPSTARVIARKIGQKYRRSKLTVPSTSICWGSYYLAELSSELRQSPVMVAAGYNAGPGRARAWQDKQEDLSADRYVEGISFSETRDYAKKVMANFINYQRMLTHDPQSQTIVHINDVIGKVLSVYSMQDFVPQNKKDDELANFLMDEIHKTSKDVSQKPSAEYDMLSDLATP